MALEKSAGTIIFRKDKKVLYYLLLRESYWGFPKGNIEKGEGLKETVKREVEEETGIKDIEFIPDFKEQIDYFYKKERKTIYKTVIFFLAETKTEKVKLSFEHTDFEWLPYEKALDKLTFKNAKEVLEKANALILKLEV